MASPQPQPGQQPPQQYYPQQGLNDQFASTLDEPITTTIARDLKAIGKKMLIVVLPFLGGDKELRDWDLWGPLILCLVLAMTLGSGAGEAQSGLVFAAVFVLVWVGSGFVTLNASFLGAKISFFQTVCAMGYCLAPMCVGAIANHILSDYLLAKFIISLLTFAWSTFASLRFFRGSIKPEREALVVYPLSLFYFFMAWMMTVGI